MAATQPQVPILRSARPAASRTLPPHTHTHSHTFTLASSSSSSSSSSSASSSSSSSKNCVQISAKKAAEWTPVENGHCSLFETANRSRLRRRQRRPLVVIQTICIRRPGRFSWNFCWETTTHLPPPSVCVCVCVCLPVCQCVCPSVCVPVCCKFAWLCKFAIWPAIMDGMVCTSAADLHDIFTDPVWFKVTT